MNASFKQISSRICTAEFKLYKEEDTGNRIDIPVVFICAYAPTLVNTKKDITTTEHFYNDLDNLISSISKRKFLILAGDFNAKTGTSHTLYPNNIGRYGKGETNLNGEFVISSIVRNELFLTNTFFKHKLAHITTWESPEFINRTHNGEIRRNPYRNQIDYIATRLNYRQFITDSRSYNGIDISTDHRIVITKFKYIYRYLVNKNNNKKIDQIATERISDPIKQK